MDVNHARTNLYFCVVCPDEVCVDGALFVLEGHL